MEIRDDEALLIDNAPLVGVGMLISLKPSELPTGTLEAVPNPARMNE